MSSSSENPETVLSATALNTREGWKLIGYFVPTKARPAQIERYKVPSYSTVYRNRHLFAFSQVYKISDTLAQERSSAAAKAVKTREENMTKGMETVELTINRGKTVTQIRELAYSMHGGNYQGDPGEFVWSKIESVEFCRSC